MKNKKKSCRADTSDFEILVIYFLRNKKITKQLNFRASGQKIKQLSQVRYLGVILQDDCTGMHI